MAGITSRSPETLFKEGCRHFGIDPLSISSFRRNLFTDGIADAQAAFLSLKGEDNIITHIYDIAAPRNMIRSQRSGLPPGYFNSQSSLAIMLGFALGVVEITSFGMVGLDDRPKL